MTPDEIHQNAENMARTIRECNAILQRLLEINLAPLSQSQLARYHDLVANGMPALDAIILVEQEPWTPEGTGT